MKYVIILGDGMADHPLADLNGKTPLQAADKPGMDYLASHGINGMCATVPDGMIPESDTANLAIMGYDPKIYSKGRSPLEALSIGVDLKDNQTAVRANIVALSDNGEPYEEKVMLDHSSDEIPTEEARVLIEHCDKMLCGERTKLHVGISYRHCFVFDDAPDFKDFARPHDIIGKCIGEYLPSGEGSDAYRELMKRSFEILNDHPINVARAARGLKKANSLWFWSPGKKPSLPLFTERTGLRGSVVCAVDLIKGIGLCAGMSVPDVAGATGTLDTNYAGKAAAALEELKANDLAYIHVEAPDECGHQGKIADKIKAIESIDEFIVRPILKELDKRGEHYRVMLLPDHPTPIALRTHVREPIPFVIYDSENHPQSGVDSYDDFSGKNGVFVSEGDKLIDLFLNRGE